MKLDDVIKGVRDGLTDLATVEVLTFTGNLEQVLDGAAGTPRTIKWKELRGFQGSLQLAAATQIDADYDIVNFRSSDLPDDLRALHGEAVKTSLDARRAFLAMFLDLLKRD